MPSFFTVITVTYRFPFGLALAPLRKLKGCRAVLQASSLTATLDSFKTYSIVKLLLYEYTTFINSLSKI